MSDTNLPQFIQYGTQADRIAYIPSPPQLLGSDVQVLYLWYETDNPPDLYVWDGSNWVQINSTVGGITQLTGDVTAGPGSGSQVATIANNAVVSATILDEAVTYAKIQDISAASKLLGRGSAGGAGVTEEITLGTNLSMSGATLNASGGGGGGGLVGIQVIDTPGAGTYTPTGGTGQVIVVMIGAGGGGSGAATPGGANVAFGRSGGSGAVITKHLTTGFSGAAYVVGAGGAGGSAGANNGADGADTTFEETIGPTTFSADGGKAGTSVTSNAPPIIFLGGAPGVAAGGDINVSGEWGESAICLLATSAYAGAGGQTAYGPGGRGGFIAAINTAEAGQPPDSGYGGGGGGGLSVGSGGNVAGADGADGAIIIYEYA